MKPVITRPQQIAKRITITDGFSRAGKVLMGSLLSALDDSEMYQLNVMFQYQAILHHLGEMSNDAAVTMLNHYADMDLYQFQLGRYTNFRPTDVSGAPYNLWEEKQKERLLKPEGQVVVDDLLKRQPLLHLMTHFIFHINDIFFDAFKERLELFVVMLRHPYWIIESWYQGNWKARFGREEREWNLCCQVKGLTVPWFAADWAQEYDSLSRFDQSVAVISYLMDAFHAKLESMPDNNKRRCQFVPFEKLASDPLQVMTQIAAGLSTRCNDFTDKVMAANNVPREIQRSEIDAKRIELFKLAEGENASPRTLELLTKQAELYESRYLEWL